MCLYSDSWHLVRSTIRCSLLLLLTVSVTLIEVVPAIKLESNVFLLLNSLNLGLIFYLCYMREKNNQARISEGSDCIAKLGYPSLF